MFQGRPGYLQLGANRSPGVRTRRPAVEEYPPFLARDRNVAVAIAVEVGVVRRVELVKQAFCDDDTRLVEGDGPVRRSHSSGRPSALQSALVPPAMSAES